MASQESGNSGLKSKLAAFGSRLKPSRVKQKVVETDVKASLTGLPASLSLGRLTERFDQWSPRRRTAVAVIGYALLGLALFLVFTVLTFPSDKVAELGLLMGEQRAKVGLEADDYDGYLLTGVSYRNLRVYTDIAKNEPPTVTFDEIYGRISLLNLLLGRISVSGGGRVYDGHFDYSFTNSSKTVEVEADIDEIDLSKLDYFKNRFGASLLGKLSAGLDYKSGEKGKNRGNGKFTLNVGNFGFEGLDLGIIKIEPITNEAIRGDFVIEDGIARTRVFKLEGDALSANLDGRIVLGDVVEQTKLSFEVELKPSDQRESDLGFIFKQIRLKKSRKGDYVYKFSKGLGQLL